MTSICPPILTPSYGTLQEEASQCTSFLYFYVKKKKKKKKNVKSQIENPKGWSTQKESQKRESMRICKRQIENLKGRFTQKESKRKSERAYQIENLNEWSRQKLRQSKSVELRDDLIFPSGGTQAAILVRSRLKEKSVSLDFLNFFSRLENQLDPTSKTRYEDIFEIAFCLQYCHDPVVYS